MDNSNTSTGTDLSLLISSVLVATVVVILIQFFFQRLKQQPPTSTSGSSPPSSTSVTPEAPLPNLKHGEKKYTRGELKNFDGIGKPANWPILIGINGIVFDVTSKREVYGPGGAYGVFAGRDASRGLAMSSLNVEDVQSTDLSDLDEKQKKTLFQWEEFFKKRYPVVGEVVND